MPKLGQAAISGILTDTTESIWEFIREGVGRDILYNVDACIRKDAGQGLVGDMSSTVYGEVG